MDAVAMNLSGRFYSRTTLLVAFLLFELTLAWSFRNLGWFETGGVIRWGACAIMALLPLAVAAALMARRRFRFGLRTLLIAMSLLAIFMCVSVLPLYEAIEARRGSQSLEACGAQMDLAFNNDEYFKQMGYDPRRAAPVYQPEATLPVWLRPLAAETLQVAPDDSVRGIGLENDVQVAAFAEHASRFTCVTSIGLGRGVGLRSRQTLAKLMSELPDVDQLHVYSPVTAGWLRADAFDRLRSLTIYGMPQSPDLISDELLKEIAGLPDLRHLSLRWVETSDADLQLLAKSASLRLIVLGVVGATSPGFEELERAMPNCQIKGTVVLKQPSRWPRSITSGRRTRATRADGSP
ncbi:MAG: hypothetical protein C0485_06070 [Pirellula sp.]|nr:hypothetical protein [Pirellula sp.]